MMIRVMICVMYSMWSIILVSSRFDSNEIMIAQVR